MITPTPTLDLAREALDGSGLTSIRTALAALITEHEQLLARISVAREGAQATLDAGDALTSALRLVRAHLELAKSHLGQRHSDAIDHVVSRHMDAATKSLDNLGVPAPRSSVLATAALDVVEAMKAART